MPVKSFKPTSAGLRHKDVADFSVLTKGKKPEKALLEIKKRSGDMLDSLQERINSLEPTGTIE